VWQCGVTSGSGTVAVRWLDGGWQCGHFDRWQVDNPFFQGWGVALIRIFCIIWGWVVARGVALAVGGVSVAVGLNEWQWHSGSALAGWGVAVRSF
jgi:hypothetical protein